ncbi:phosphatase PAP2 family protein [Streptacidiphilus melanogenes]|uniref:phosphatase PAP2 family protein n=1 Tax=Streptacidiphilus melanogenes TaxID=411235 RepID=UPI0009FF5F7C|nr:phosphatase PAP2 family protein [Streptacidiphilus melanogenes]
MSPSVTTAGPAPAETTGQAAPGAPRAWGRAGWLRELLLVAVVYFAYDGSRLLVRGGVQQAQRDASHLLDVERWLHLDPEHWLNADFTDHRWLGIPADFAYASLHYLVTPAVLVWLWRHHREVYRRARTWLGLSTVLALVGFVLFPAAPPRLLPAGFGFTDTMAQHSAIGWWGGDASTPKGLASMTNEFAAMPSLHVGWALWCGLMLLTCARDRTVRTLGALYPVVIALVVMGTANHYLLDVLAGAGVIAVGRALTGPVLRLWDRRLARPRP